MKLQRILFLPGGMPQFWKGEEERRSRLEATPASDFAKSVELELLPNGLIQLIYDGQPFFIGPHAVAGMVPLPVPKVEEKPAKGK